jgi:amino acid adenylation domain-containing protein
MGVLHLAEYLEASAAEWPNRTAVVDPAGSSLTYAELDRQANAVAAYLAAKGIRAGDRVGVVLPKSASAVSSLFGIMKAQAAYVPVDYSAPIDRIRRILTDCGVRAIIVDERCLAIQSDGHLAEAVTLVANSARSDSHAHVTLESVLASPAAPTPERETPPDALAYILYTSGSTGIPKGVMLTHENAVSFVEWCTSVLKPTPEDRFSSHAPFHFDLSVLDIYVSIKHGATLYLVSEDLGRNPAELARFIAVNRLTVWYSTPSILTLLVQFGNLQTLDWSALRLVLFAGEVFPIKHLRNLHQHWPHPDYYNLYGPTETNVCTFAHIPHVIDADRQTPFGIGVPCSHCASLVLDDSGQEVASGSEGLLYISGPSVFSGYWNRPQENAQAFTERSGVRWYNTGDVVRWDSQEGFIYLGRKDRMVKRRGFRIELGEIERALYAHEHTREAAVIAMTDADTGVKIVAFVSMRQGQSASTVALKTFCSTKVPAYMIPDRFIVKEQLPRTSTDKVDYQALKGELIQPAVN